MQCVVHANEEAIGTCTSCGQAVCASCKPLKHDPRLHCQECLRTEPIQGFDYRSKWNILGVPLLHITFGINAVTLKPAVAKGVIAIGSRAFGLFALGRRAMGLFSVGEVSAGIALSVGGVSASTGVSIGGVSMGVTAIGGIALGLTYAFGGFAYAEHVITPMLCDLEAFFLVRDISSELALPNSCRSHVYPY